jgi:hypothetical protein
MNKIYARVIDGQIAEYPVYEIHIRNRAQPLDWYTEVEHASYPMLTHYQYAEEQLGLFGNRVLVNYVVRDHDLAYLFNMAYDVTKRKVTSLDGTPFGLPVDKAGKPSPIIEDQFIKNMEPAFFDALKKAADSFVTNHLKSYAHGLGFDDIISLISYKDSTVPEWATAAQDFIIKRDLTWTVCIELQNKLANNEIAIPRKLEEFTNKLPV